MANPDEFHAALTPNLVDEPHNGVLHLTVDKMPKTAKDIIIRIIEVDTWDRGQDTTQLPDEVLLTMRGAVNNGTLSVHSTATPPKFYRRPMVRLIVDTTNPPRLCPVYLRPQSSDLKGEGPNFELVVEISGLVNKARITYRSNVPACVRRYPSFAQRGREVIACMTGTGPYFDAAKVYWDECADRVDIGNFNLDMLIRGLKTRNVGSTSVPPPYGEVNIVCHGSPHLIIIPRTQREALCLEDYQGHEEIQEAVTWQTGPVPTMETAPGPNVLDQNSIIVIRGCNIGMNRPMLEQLHALFGGRSPVYAPKHYIGYAVGPPTFEFFREWKFREVKQQSPPTDSAAERTEVEKANQMQPNTLTDPQHQYSFDPSNIGHPYWIKPNVPPKRGEKKDADLDDPSFLNKHKQIIKTGDPAYNRPTWQPRDSNSMKNFDEFEWAIDKTSIPNERHIISYLWRSRYWRIMWSAPNEPEVPDPRNAAHFAHFP